MAANNQQFGNRSDNLPRKVNEVSISIDEYLDKLTSLMERLIIGNTQQVKACGICTFSGHMADACPTLHEERTIHANAVGGFSGPSQRGHDHFSNTYNPEWRVYPNLRYDNQPQNFQRPPYQPTAPPHQSNSNSGTSLEDIVKILTLSTQQFQQETRASIQNLESQMSQLASSVSLFGIPSTRRGVTGHSLDRTVGCDMRRMCGRLRDADRHARARTALEQRLLPIGDCNTVRMGTSLMCGDAIRQV
ncbi:UNVERIFIED_CONTAM: hypothetical protein Sradi_3867000 [Sesamum radiatum]|uniref:CCHC-type domain-containing protein n=1 Tax=Sesamum radiatum TaxID=300843 RepID=A0AAW2Q285_SESRA